MKIFIFLLSLIFLTPEVASAQSRFQPDSISIEYAQCKGDTAKIDVLLINRGTTMEILDLRFADSNRTWEIYDTSGTYTFIKGAVLLGKDTLKLRLRQRRIGVPGVEWYRDTLVTSGAATSDTLLLNSRILTADLKTDLTEVDLGTILQNESASYAFRIWNDGEVPHVFHYTLSPGWVLEGLAIGDTLMPGDTVDVVLALLSTANIGTFTTMIWIHGDCAGLEPRNGKVKIVPVHAYWTSQSLVDTLSGCDEPRTFEVSIKNSSPGDTRIDSVQFVGQGSPSWVVSDVNLFPWLLPSGATKTVTLLRNPGATSTRLVIHSNKPGEDTLPVMITSRVTKPRIRNHRDTTVLSATEDQNLVYLLEIQNQGPGLYRLTDYQLTGSPLWTVLGFDTVSTAGLSKTLQVKLVFAGSSSEGDFPATIRLQGSECDTILQQTLIARVATLGVAEAIAESRVQVYPSIASTAITLQVDAVASYSVFDVLGNMILSGDAEAETLIDISSLAQGTYYLRVTMQDVVVTRPIIVRR